jgi:hypothetical protein
LLGGFAEPSAQSDGMGNMSNMGSTGNEQVAHNLGDGHRMDMGPHMKMTSLLPLRPGDQQKAKHVVEVAGKVCEKYKDYKAALADGFQIFLPNVPQKQYHFNKPEYALEAAQHFNPEHPTSLLYEKDGNGYKLVGVMYTAPRWASEDELNERIPLSIAQWHAHVNLCLPPANRKEEVTGPAPKFGFHGSISTEADCRAADGRFVPQAFGWMVHVYPFAPTPAEVWSVERQMQHDD